MTNENKKLVFIANQDEYNLFAYKPTLFHPVLIEYEKISLKIRLRYLRNYLRKGKYVIYYLEKDGKYLGMCAVTPGGTGIKIKCAEKQDIILGPYYIDKINRGYGYSKILISMVLKSHQQYRYAFDLIANSNKASQRASLACGFTVYQNIKIQGFFGKHYPSDKENSTHTIYRYEHAM